MTNESPVSGASATNPATTSAATFSALAILAFVFAFVFYPAGIVCGHIALVRTSRSGQRGHGLALAAVIIGWAFLVLDVVLALTGHLFFSVHTS